MRDITETVELASTSPEVNVPPEEYVRLLGYPHGWALEGRARELADQARLWYTQNGHPWFYARQAGSFEIGADSIRIDGVEFSCNMLQNTLKDAKAHSVILAAVGAGIEAEEESQQLWQEGKPDEYFFLEIFGSAVVEQLTTAIGARLCEWAEQRGMAILPHYSPGYPEWDIREQPRLLELMKRTRCERFPSRVEVFETGMLRPKKTQLAVFGLTRQTAQLQRLTNLVPCERCSFGPCQYRRAPYRRAPRPAGEPLPMPDAVLAKDAKYSINLKALQRWATERLALSTLDDGSIEAIFRYDGTTCSNMGMPLKFHYTVKLGPRAEGYPIREQSCAPDQGETGYEFMCKYLEAPEALMKAIENEKPFNGEHLNDVLKWQRGSSMAGCFCEVASREHKWGLVLETIHYALAQRELAQETEQ